MQKRLSHFLLLSICIIFIVMSASFTVVYSDVRMIENFPIYITLDRAFSFQLMDNITKICTLTTTNNVFNVTTDFLVLRHDFGEAHFIPHEDCTIRINHNMDYVTIEDNSTTITAIEDDDTFNIYSNDYIILLFRIKGYDVSGVVFQIFMGIISIGGLIITPPICMMITKDKMESLFAWIICWLFFGMLFLVWIYS